MADKERRDPNVNPDPNREGTKQNPQWKPGEETTKTPQREGMEER